MERGTVKNWNPERGFGFIRPDAGGTDVFVHVTALRRGGSDVLVKGERVAFEISIDDKGRPRAAKIELLSRDLLR